MSKKDYQALARAIFEARTKALRLDHPSDALAGIGEAQDGIADVLAAGNERFDRDRFAEACATGRCKGMPR
jgi:hypothetical protein